MLSLMVFKGETGEGKFREFLEFLNFSKNFSFFFNFLTNIFSNYRTTCKLPRDPIDAVFTWVNGSGQM